MMILVEKNRQDLLKITSLVIFIHIILMIWMTFTWKIIPVKNKSQKLVVNTVQLNPKPISNIIEEKPTVVTETINEKPLKEASLQLKEATQSPSTEKKITLEKIEEKASLEKVQKSNPIEKKPVEKKILSKPVEKVVKKVETKKPITTQKKVESKNKPITTQKKETVQAKKAETKPLVKTSQIGVSAADVKAKKEADEKQQQLIATLKNSMAKLEKGQSSINVAKSNLSKTTNVKAAITNLQVDSLSVSTESPLSVGEKSYVDELINRLKLELKLPTHGEVELKLTLDRSGKVRTIKIISSQSTINTSHVEKNLKTMKFPGFGSHFKDYSEYPFTIKLSNL